MNSFTLALSTLVGTIVGAGIFGIPFVMVKSGIVPGLFSLFLLGGIICLLHLFFGEICLRTSGKHRLVGYAKIYLGERGKVFATLTLLFVLVGTLLAYLILVGEFSEIVFGAFLPLSSTTFTVLFSVCALFLVLSGRQLITRIEFFTTIIFVGAIAALIFLSLPHFKSFEVPLFDFSNLSNLFLPFGVFLFAFAGFEAIPEAMSFLRDRNARTKLDNVIIWSSVITGAFFLLFVFIVIGVSGSATSPDAFSGLVPFLGQNIIAFGALIGILVIADSFLVIGNYLKNSLRHDFNFPYIPAALIAIGVPLVLFLLGFREFISVIGVVGGVTGAVQGILVMKMFYKAKTMGDRVPEYQVRVPIILPFLLGAILVGGAVAELLF
jgi:amino acid permease